MTLWVKVAGGLPIGLGEPEARQLIGRLWEISENRGAVVAIARLNHSLAEGHMRSPLELTEHEALAIRIALEARDDLPASLGTLRHVVTSVAPR